MRAISIKQPWVECILSHGKDIENRSWKPPAHIIGQRVAIHASTKFDKVGAMFANVLAGQDFFSQTLPVGKIVGTCIIAGWIETETKLTSELSMIAYLDSEWIMGDRYGWVLKDVLKLDTPIPATGALGFWRVPGEIASRLE